jgi:hypothetical protein
LLAWGLPVAFQIVAARAKYYQTRAQFSLRVFLHQVATVPFLVASGLMLNSAAEGLYWLAAGVVLALVVALQNAWVLLIEIMR